MKPLIVFYDGPCVFCNFWVQQLCRWDKNDQLRFARLDQKLFVAFALERNLTLENLDTVVAWDQEYSYALEAQAAFMVLRRLGGFWKILGLFSLLPKGLTNALYRFVAKNRYSWFGKNDQCPLPDQKYTHKFLD